MVTQCAQSFNGTNLGSHAYTYDALDRATARNSDTFAYNTRSEVSGASIGTNAYGYSYDGIGNNLWNARNTATNGFTANALNQYAAINALPLTYDPDGNLLTNGVWSYAWDAENRLVAVASNDVTLVANAYDPQHRRIRKVTPAATHAYVYDGWNLIHETVAATGGCVTEIQYFWGLDLSGTLQGAGGVGGLLAVSMDGSFFFPCYDNNGNITDYVDETGAIVASYLYDAYGGTISQSGPMADAFPHRFSTKYHDDETGLYYYGYRFYAAVLMRWVSRDPIEEQGGENLYHFSFNAPVNRVDPLGDDCIVMSHRRVVGPTWHYALELFRGCCPPVGQETDYATWFVDPARRAEARVELLNIQGVTAEHFGRWQVGPPSRTTDRRGWRRIALSATFGISAIHFDVWDSPSVLFASVFDEAEGDVDARWALAIAAARTYAYAEEGRTGRRIRPNELTFRRFPHSIYYAFGNNSNVFIRYLIGVAGLHRLELRGMHPPGWLAPRPDGLVYTGYRNPRVGW
jgi:RHS repeat-associated protein